MEAAGQLKDSDEGEGSVGEPTLPGVAARRRAAIELVRNHRSLLMASARRVSLCGDDAEDALQRGLEILLTKAPTDDTRRLLPWARTVIRNEALAIRRTRERTLGRPSPSAGEDREGDAGDWVGRLPSERRGPEDVVEGRERVARSREALATLKPQELKALTQLATGMSYAEISAVNGWTRTKVNRCLAEGREKLRSVVRESEAGERCRLVEPLISAAADDELDPESFREVRNHLAVCGGCRATLREYRRLPAAVVSAAPFLATLGEGAIDPSARAPGFLARAGERLEELPIQAWLRLNGLFGGGDPAPAAALGGSRGFGATALAKLAAVCVGTAGGAAACLGTGLVAVPGEQPRMSEPAAVERPVALEPVTPVEHEPPAPVEPEAPEGDREQGDGGGRESESPPSDPVVAEFSPGTTTPAPASTTASPTPPPPAPAKSVPLGGSSEFGP